MVAQGTIDQIIADPESLIAPFLDGTAPVVVREQAADVFDIGALHLATAPLHTVHALDVRIPKGRFVAVTGMSGSGKTTLVLDSLVPALKAAAEGIRLPSHVREVDAAGITKVHVVDATPIGVNVRSTVATYSGILDELRRLYAATDAARERGLTAGDFSYNTGSLYW